MDAFCPLIKDLCRDDCKWYDRIEDTCKVEEISYDLYRIAETLEKHEPTEDY